MYQPTWQKKIVERVLEESYRKKAQAVESMTHEALSHTTVWNVVQKIGDKLEKQEEEKIAKYEEGKLNGEREVRILFSGSRWDLAVHAGERQAKAREKQKEGAKGSSQLRGVEKERRIQGRVCSTQ